MKTLLLVIDIQNDFLSHPRLSPHSSCFLHNLTDLVVDCRSNEIPVAHVRMEWDPHIDDRMPHWKERNTKHCIKGSEGVAAPDTLKPLNEERCFIKKGFSAFIGTGLAEWLAEEKIEMLWFAGLYTHTCIRQSALDAYQLGFHVKVCTDAVASYDPFAAACSLLYLERRGIPHQPRVSLRQPIESQLNAETEIEAVIAAIQPDSQGSAVIPLEKLAQCLEARAKIYASVICEEIAKPIRMAEDEVNRAIKLIESNIELFESENASIESDEGIIRFRARGIIAVITPWNNPLAIPIGQLVPALLYGNAVIWKPSPLAIRISKLLFEDMLECGLAPNSLKMLFGGSRMTCRLAGHPRLDAVTFTGSCESAWMVAAACKPNGTELQAEMGGNNAAILWPDLNDPSKIAREVVEAAFGFAGQRCTALRRVIVPESELEGWWERLSQATASLNWGDPQESTTEVGPVISENKADELRTLIHRSRNDLSRCNQPHLDDCNNLLDRQVNAGYFPPTLAICNLPDSEIVQTESFGPILIIQPAKDFNHAMNLLNGVRQGLCASLMGGDITCRNHFETHAEAGILKLGRIDAGAGISMPFGGWKASGWGPPQHGQSNRNFYSKLQAIYNRKNI